ncbi:MAG TPA: hypothetical protein VIK14_09460 [Ignavibacteria bacterium]
MKDDIIKEDYSDNSVELAGEEKEEKKEEKRKKLVHKIYRIGTYPEIDDGNGEGTIKFMDVIDPEVNVPLKNSSSRTTFKDLRKP